MQQFCHTADYEPAAVVSVLCSHTFPGVLGVCQVWGGLVFSYELHFSSSLWEIYPRHVKRLSGLWHGAVLGNPRYSLRE